MYYLWIDVDLSIKRSVTVSGCKKNKLTEGEIYLEEKKTTTDY